MTTQLAKMQQQLSEHSHFSQNEHMIGHFEWLKWNCTSRQMMNRVTHKLITLSHSFIHSGNDFTFTDTLREKKKYMIRRMQLQCTIGHS